MMNTADEAAWYGHTVVFVKHGIITMDLRDVVVRTSTPEAPTPLEIYTAIQAHPAGEPLKAIDILRQPARVVKTQAEVDQLILSWNPDPTWDIETTEGFEEWHDYLLTHRLDMEQRWKLVEQRTISALARELGIPTAAARYVSEMRQRIERRLDRVEARLELD